MSDQKGDRFTATGSHRAWVGEGKSKAPVAPAPVDTRTWLGRSQNANPRHAAITRALNNFPSYKSWVEKIKDDWDKK